MLSVDAYDMGLIGRLTIIDIRPAAERAEHGTAVNTMAAAFPTGLFESHTDFVRAVSVLVEGDRQRPLALLCRRGVTSRQAQKVLQDAGFAKVYNIADGFLGSEAGPGWRQWGLPILPSRTKVQSKEGSQR